MSETRFVRCGSRLLLAAMLLVMLISHIAVPCMASTGVTAGGALMCRDHSLYKAPVDTDCMFRVAGLPGAFKVPLITVLLVSALLAAFLGRGFPSRLVQRFRFFFRARSGRLPFGGAGVFLPYMFATRDR